VLLSTRNKAQQPPGSDVPVLLLGWGYLPSMADSAPEDGGVTALRLDGDGVAWTTRLGMPVRGGPALSSDSLLVGYGASGVAGGDGGLAVLETHSGELQWRVPVGGGA
jgi:outer membrane protein assembly factor BamB